MKLHNTLTRRIEDFQPLDGNNVRMYSCGPTVYDHIHIGNLSAFIAADMLRRTLKANGHNVTHVMNFTDVDDKTIRRSQEDYPDMEPGQALKELTRHYEDIFLHDMKAIGNGVQDITFIRATESIESMRQLITQLYKDGFAYIADDGVYFSIEKYRAEGKTYGQLLSLSTETTSNARIDNDEYDKESVHDFALWKTQKGNEPAWEFYLDEHDLLGRPGWHIECSAMSQTSLGQPFDIHTGGIDLVFPHHENEIAQSTAGKSDTTMARYFVHNEHLLVDGRKMSKSLGNFYTLRDIQERGYSPLAFRLMVLQGHYRSATNFSWDNLEAAQNRLKALQAMADLRFQTIDRDDKATAEESFISLCSEILPSKILSNLGDDLATPEALSVLSMHETQISDGYISSLRTYYETFLSLLDEWFGLQLMDSKDITDEQKSLIVARQQARNNKDFTASDELRNKLLEQGIGLRDTAYGQIWYRI